MTRVWTRFIIKLTFQKPQYQEFTLYCSKIYAKQGKCLTKHEDECVKNPNRIISKLFLFI